jgi:putative ABC transport system permease protein
VRSMSMEHEPNPIVFIPLVQALPDHMAGVPQTLSYVVRTSGEPTALLPAVRQAVWALDANLPLAEIRTLESVVRRSMARTSFTMVLLGIAALVALLLGTVGIYGAMSYVVSQRTREIGVRMALGADEQTVAAMVLRQGAALAGAGIVLGIAAAVGLTRLMQALLYGVSATDPTTFAGVALALALVALLASYLPARRAARVAPVEALRAD